LSATENFRELTILLSKQFLLGTHSPHGPSHWMRVRNNGLILADQTGANKKVVELFSIFHDSKRENENTDHGHGARGAKLAQEYFDKGLINCSVEELELVIRACQGHTGGTNPNDITIATCWDADRLDLPRVGIKVDPNLLCTEEAKEPSFIKYCSERAIEWVNKQRLKHNDDWELSGVRKLPTKDSVVIYISGRGGNANKGLGAWIKSIQPNRIGLSVNQQFLSFEFEKQVQVIQDLIEEFDSQNTLIIANSYGAYLLLQALFKLKQLDSRIVLLAPVMGRGINSKSMYMSRPPGEENIKLSMRSGGLLNAQNISVHIGGHDNAETVVNISNKLGIKNVQVLDGEGHSLPKSYIQQLLNNYLT